MNQKNITLSHFVWFQLALGLPLLLSIIVIFLINKFDPDIGSVCFRAECFNNLYETFRVPLWLAGLSLALSGIAAAVHRSNETAKQIHTSKKQYEATLVKNSFDLFVKHQEVFVKGVSDLLSKYNSLDEGSNDKIIVDMQYLYSKMFNNTPAFFESYYAKKDFNITEDYERELSKLYYEAKGGRSFNYTADMVEYEFKISHENLFYDSYVNSDEEKAKFAIRYCNFCTELFVFLRNTFIQSK